MVERLGLAPPELVFSVGRLRVQRFGLVREGGGAAEDHSSPFTTHAAGQSPSRLVHQQ